MMQPWFKGIFSYLWGDIHDCPHDHHGMQIKPCWDGSISTAGIGTGLLGSKWPNWGNRLHFYQIGETHDLSDGKQKTQAIKFSFVDSSFRYVTQISFIFCFPDWIYTFPIIFLICFLTVCKCLLISVWCFQRLLLSFFNRCNIQAIQQSSQFQLFNFWSNKYMDQPPAPLKGSASYGYFIMSLESWWRLMGVLFS